ncbi:MAG: MarR family transcriptional regulator [Coriobacteriia bacterium]|nr:MarR family transcriptional regulator [Coriobacteriia bacterium]
MRLSSDEITSRVRLNQARTKRIKEVLGIDATSYDVLGLLARETERATVGEIRKRLGISKFKASQAVHALELRGYASSWSPLEDHRAVLTATSRYGREMLDHSRARIESTADADTDWWDAFRSAVSESDAGSVCEARVLILMRENGDLAVREIVTRLDLPQSTASVALRALVARGLVSCRRGTDGRNRFYFVTDVGMQCADKILDRVDKRTG